MSEAGPDRREATLAKTFVMLADTLVDDFDVTDLFDRLTSACVELLGAATAGLMLVDQHGALQLMASSSEAMRALELFEMSHDQGPCMECYATRQPLSADLRDPDSLTRWPKFTAEALRNSVTLVQALPMRLRGNTIGALNIFHTTEARLSDHDTAIAQAMADLATIALLQRHALSSSAMLSAQLQEAAQRPRPHRTGERPAGRTGRTRSRCRLRASTPSLPGSAPPSHTDRARNSRRPTRP